MYTSPLFNNVWYILDYPSSEFFSTSKLSTVVTFYNILEKEYGGPSDTVR